MSGSGASLRESARQRSERFPVRRPSRSPPGLSPTAHRLPSTSKERERDPTASPALLRNRDKTGLKEAWP